MNQIILSKNHTKIPFYGLKQNLRVGEQVLREIHKSYNFPIQSSTFWTAKVAQHIGKPSYKNLSCNHFICTV